ncbi:MAG: hypothetical protein K2X72_23000 [Reyranella sp.]|nr:hypothetical protein [Reyranella sp.]
MAGLKGLAARVKKLEPKPNNVLRKIGSIERFEAECEAGIADGRYDPADMRDVMLCIRRWVVTVK